MEGMCLWKACVCGRHVSLWIACVCRRHVACVRGRHVSVEGMYLGMAFVYEWHVSCRWQVSVDSMCL